MHIITKNSTYFDLIQVFFPWHFGFLFRFLISEMDFASELFPTEYFLTCRMPSPDHFDVNDVKSYVGKLNFRLGHQILLLTYIGVIFSDFVNFCNVWHLHFIIIPPWSEICNRLSPSLSIHPKWMQNVAGGSLFCAVSNSRALLRSSWRNASMSIVFSGIGLYIAAIFASALHALKSDGFFWRISRVAYHRKCKFYHFGDGKYLVLLLSHFLVAFYLNCSFLKLFKEGPLGICWTCTSAPKFVWPFALSTTDVSARRTWIL